MPLHLSKVAVGCASLSALAARIEARADGGEVRIVTRYRPKRAEELAGGSLYWIVKHRLVARQAILDFAARDEDRKTLIRLDAMLVPVHPLARRAHQGWRYLAEADAPADLGGADGLAELPEAMAGELARLGLI